MDIHDRPYEPLTAAARALDLTAIKNGPHPARPDASLGVPPAPRNPLGHFTIRLALQDWDRERGFVKPISELPEADLYVCWDSRAIYLGVYAQDIAETDFYRDKIVPEVDRAEWIISIGESQPPSRFTPASVRRDRRFAMRPAVRVVNLAGELYEHTQHCRHGIAGKTIWQNGVQTG